MAAKTFSLQATFNGLTVKKRTDNLEETIHALKPDWLHTDVDITVKKGKREAVRHLSLSQAKRVFNNDITRQVFVNNLFI